MSDIKSSLMGKYNQLLDILSPQDNGGSNGGAGGSGGSGGSGNKQASNNSNDSLPTLPSANKQSQNGQNGQSKQGEQNKQGTQSVGDAVRQLQQDNILADANAKSQATKNAAKKIKMAIDKLRQALNSGNKADMQDALDNLADSIGDMSTASPNDGAQLQQDFNNIVQAISNSQNNGMQDLNGVSETEGDIDGQADGNMQDSSSKEGQGNGIGSTGSIDTGRETKVTFRGRELTVKVENDIKTAGNSLSKEAANARAQDTLARIRTRIDMEEKKQGRKLAMIGNGEGGGALADIDIDVRRTLNWRVLLRNALAKERKDIYSTSHPDRRMMANGYFKPGALPAGKPTKASGIQIAIDTSGSVNESDIEKMLSEIAGMFLKVSLEGQLIYWDTSVCNAGEIQGTKDLLKVKPKGGGGTDVKSVFDYLMLKSKVNNQFSPIKPKDITKIFIVTDGYFHENYADYDRAFGRKTVWLIYGQSNFTRFDPPFGTKVLLDVDI